MIHSRVIHKNRKTRSELIRYIALCEKYKLEITKIAEDHNKKLYSNNEIDYNRYISKSYETFNDKPLECWLLYYDNYIESYKEKIKSIDQSIKSLQKHSTFTNYTLITLILIMSGFFLFTSLQAGITGMAVTNLTTTANVTVLDAAPTVNVSIDPSAPYTNNSLFCNASTYDANLDTVIVYYSWFKDGVINTSLNNVTTVASSNTSKGENWTCQATPNDGTQNGTAVNASVLIQNYPANVSLLEITDHLDNYSDMALTPISGARANAAIRATIYDIDGFTNQSVTSYLCDIDDYSICNSTNYTYAINLTYLEPASGTDEYYYTYNGTNNTPQFWKQNGTWKLFVRIVDEGSTNNNESDFTYNELRSINYSSNVTLGDGDIQIGEWNNGTFEYIMTNLGNIILSLQWNASHPIMNATENMTLNGTDFAVDDDMAVVEDTNNIQLTYLNATNKTFEPSSGLLRCASDSCLNENATLPTYYHIYPPIGLKPGTYNTTITITLNTKN